MRFSSYDGGLQVEAGHLPPVWFHGSVVGLAIFITLPLRWGLHPSKLSAVPIVMAGTILAILAHELGHTLAARRCGFDTTLIRLHALGGEAIFAGPV